MKRFACALAFLSLSSVTGAPSYHHEVRLPAVVVAQDIGSPVEPQRRTLDDYLKAITAYTGTHVVFDSADLPNGKYYDIMTTLSAERKLKAAQLTLREFHKYPKGYLGKIGIKAIGIFNACASKRNDGYHRYDETLKGYRYFGVWNGNNGIAAAYYTDDQLPLTLHHEIFHHVDATRNGVTDYDVYFKHDERFKEIQEGKKVYDAARLTRDERASLNKVAVGHALESVVGDYCKKSSSEDKAETARWLMSHLPDALLQIHSRPELAGSQRLLHVLHRYEHALKDGPGVSWFVERALDRKGTQQLDKHQDPPVKQVRDNPYLAKVDDAIADPAVRNAIRKVQPACVRLDRGSGVCISADGHVLTCAHVARKLGNQLSASFPDGRKFTATCIALDSRLDLALLKLDTNENLPFASLAAAAPAKGTRIVCIGQPGSRTPSGEKTGYQPFHVSTGKIRGFLDDPLGDQALGRTKHDAWTYWGHSGSPLFNESGQLIALHNSWDSTTAMRHAITYQAIVHFLKREKIDFDLANCDQIGLF